MATLFQAFRASEMPKRLLRYALSRLELLDADALDLDNLDFAWGRNTVLEFRDVGIRLEKLEGLLKLPDPISILKAKVTLLRATIPVNFYTSPIIIEVSDVQVQLKVASKNKSGARVRTKAHGDSDLEVVPNTVDLAQSFLQTQPLAEKKQLEEALLAETHDLGASVEISDSEDDDLAYGTGQALTLPTFMADFLQGIVDRVQLRIQGVTFKVDVEVSVDPSMSTPELVTFELSLDSIDVEGVTSPAAQEEEPQRIVPRVGKRHISLNEVRAFLISEANVFTTLARSPSSLAAHSPVLAERSTLSREPSELSKLAKSIPRDPLEESSVLDQSQHSVDAFDIPYDMDELGSDPEDDAQHSLSSTPRASICEPAEVRRDGPPAMSAVMDRPLVWASPEEGAHSAPGLVPMSYTTPMEASRMSSISSRSEPLNDETPGGEEDLTKSHVFTHEEAESMYMSAFSQMGGIPDGGPSEDESSKQSNPDTSSSGSLSQSLDRLQEDKGSERETAHGSVDENEAMDASAGTVSPPPVTLAQPELSQILDSDQNDADQDDTASLQNEMETPRGPTRLVKEILSLKSISIYVPSAHKHLELSTADVGHPGLDKSISPKMPGAFSVHMASVHSEAQADKVLYTTTHDSDGSIEVDLSPLEVRFDMSVGFLLTMVVSTLVDALKVPAEEPTEAPGDDNPAKSPPPDVKVNAEKICLNFMEKLAGVADTPGRIFEPSPVTLDADVLLTTCLQGLTISTSTTASSTTTQVDLEKFTFGYAQDPILSFNKQMQLQASITDALPSPGADISVKIESSSKATRCGVFTLPLLVQLDLLRIDETFSWFGGLSSFLNMGSSVTSSTSPTIKTAVKPPVKRGVRFQDEFEEAPASVTKIDVRVGGLHVDVIGKDCSVALDSTAVKVASRGGIIGVGISRMRLTGPFTKYSRDPPITAELGNTRVEYQNGPSDKDLERLLEMITPSVFKFDDGDEIMVDTLLRQRRKGPVLRVDVGNGFVKGKNLAALSCLSSLADDVARLATVAKYLPEDDRPGILTLAKIQNFDVSLDCGGKIGKFNGSLKDLEVAHIPVPSLVALGVGGMSVYRNGKEELLGSSETSPREPSYALLPVLMVRIIGDEIEPVIKVKMRDLRVEYRVPTIMDFLDLTSDATPQDFEAAMAASVANLAEHAHGASVGKGKAPAVEPPSSDPRRTRVNITFRDCIIGLNPLNIPSKMLVILTDSSLDVLLPKDENMKVEFSVAESRLLLIDDTARLGEPDDAKISKRRISEAGPGPQVQELAERGYVSVLEMKSAKIAVDIQGNPDGDEKFVTVHVENNPFIVLETCADSTQTLITLGNALSPPTPPSKEVKYRTNVPLIKDLLSSISPEAFGKAEGDYDFDQDFAGAQEILGSLESSQSGDVIDSNYLDAPVEDLLFDAGEMSGLSDRASVRDTADGVLLTNEDTSVRSEASSDMVIDDFYFGNDPSVEGTAHKWNSAMGTYAAAQTNKSQRSPLRVYVRDVHVIWNLFDGYDWAHTREVITKAIEEIETKMWEIKNPRYRRESAGELDMEEPAEITDCLFNSIYIGIPTNHDPRELTANINQALRAGDNETETESVATTQWTAAPSAVGGYRPKGKSPKLGRSKTHKITFELGGVCLDLVTFPPGSGETQNSIDIRVRDLTIFDHIPTSTWKKFATYDLDRGEREMGSSMVHIELLNVKPVEGLAASEIVLHARVLPLRLHVDQDALDFITRFFEFKDDTVPVHASESDVPFLQRVEVDDVPVTLDFKPKRVDYGGLRSGKTTEFMNFIVLDQSRMVLRHVILYGIKGFDKMGETLNSIWTSDVKANQLPGVLAGLAPARSLVNLGSGFRDLVEVPIREYKKDGRIIRSIGKGAFAFARKTGTEAIKLGAKLAIGTQYMLQGAEELLGNKPAGPANPELDDEEKKQISLYADQPSGVRQGLRRAYDSLSRDIAYTKDVIIGIPTEVADSKSATGLAKTVLGKAPVIILRPAIGAAKATGQLMLGVTNTVDPENKRRVDEKYKH